MKDGTNEKYSICTGCGAKCNGDDNGYDLCRFCEDEVKSYDKEEGCECVVGAEVNENV